MKSLKEALVFVYEEADRAEQRAVDAHKGGGRLDREAEVQFNAKADGMRLAASAIEARLNPGRV